jgi:hypothetical protein
LLCDSQDVVVDGKRRSHTQAPTGGTRAIVQAPLAKTCLPAKRLPLNRTG